ncbi:MAG: DUF4406 domain-containing protein [Bacteroidaceae bacterium]
MKVYISCPITSNGIKIARVLIEQAKLTLLKHGYKPISPLEICPYEDTYEHYMGRDIEALLNCDAVYFVRGWNESKGCKLEYRAAEIYDKKMMFE